MSGPEAQARLVSADSKTDPCDSLDPSDNLEQQFAEAPGWEVGSRVLYAQTQQVGSCQLMVISCEFNTKKEHKKILRNIN